MKRGWPSDKYIQSNMVCDHTENPGFDLACTDIYICTWISSWVVYSKQAQCVSVLYHLNTAFGISDTILYSVEKHSTIITSCGLMKI